MDSWTNLAECQIDTVMAPDGGTTVLDRWSWHLSSLETDVVVSVSYILDTSDKNYTLNQCWLNANPTSAMQAQHCASIGSVFCVRWTFEHQHF